MGKSHIIQVTNIGYDVTGDHSFDLQIPGGGQGIFDTGCVRQFPGGLFGGYYSTDDFDCGVRYGGCADESGCSRLPSELRAGCEWRFGDSYRPDGSDAAVPARALPGGLRRNLGEYTARR